MASLSGACAATSTFSSDPEGTVDQLVRSVLLFGAMVIAMQFLHILWSVGQAWNAQRCTLAAPRPLGMAVLFLIGPFAALLALSVRTEAVYTCCSTWHCLST